ncbi:MAG: M6 family metalloprotease domain-containing protein [Dysgonamonadaceae bacterium]|jgi:M6 family metalloprotease-like protein|nr:M6 family metalloprotease domain-containing protein [Dysgonamonadaceae bacterium]
MRKKGLLLAVIIVLFISFHKIWAVPAVPWPIEKMQPDGTKITVYLKGDEKVHWMESPDGYTLMYDSQKKIVYAELNVDGNIAPSKMIFRGDASFTPSAENIKKGLRYSPAQVKMLKQIWEIDNPGMQKMSAQRTVSEPVTGNKKALCILAGFNDKAFSKTVTDFKALMNQEGYSANGAKGSVQDFYKENSYGKMTLMVTVVGPYTLPQSTSYYGKESNYQSFASEAIQMANADVDFAEYANTNNELETFHIIFAGYGDENINNEQQIWSHKWQLKTPLLLDGVYISVYSCSPELRGSSGSTITAIGVVCHELGHVFGAPDYYDTDYEESGGNYPGTGKWDLMASGSWNGNGVTPAHINMFQKIQYGWVNPESLETYRQINNMPNAAQNPVAYTIEANANGEMYVLENRQKVGFDTGLPGHGLLIYHAHKDILQTAYQLNITHPQKLYVVSASATTAIPDATPSSYGSINSEGAPFPGTSNKTAFTDYTTPQAFSWENLQGIDKPVTNISETDGKIAFTFLEKLNPVNDLHAEIINDATVKLTWTISTSSEVTQYKIYRNDILQYTLSGKTNTTYSQWNVPNGDYQYCVVASNGILDSDKACTNVKITESTNGSCQTISNLKAKTNSGKILLTWDAPQSESVTGYKVFRNGNETATINATTYTDETAELSVTYVYCVSAEYADCSSETVCIEVTTKNPYNPAENLTLAVSGTEGDDVILNWTDPYQGGWMDYGDLPKQFYGFNGSYKDYTMAVRWTSDDLKRMGNCRLTQVKFYSHNTTPNNSHLYVQVWSGGTGIAPETLLVDEELSSYIAGDYYTHSLPTPLDIDINQELWIGLRAVQTGSENIYPLVTTNSPTVNEKGNLIYLPGSGWLTSSEFNIDANWYLCGHIELKSALNGYEISRDGVKIQDVNSSSLTYTDVNPGTGIHDYCVTATYTDGKSDPVCGNIAINLFIWKGLTTEWNNTDNWSSGRIPTAKTHVHIPKNVPNFPILTQNKANNICSEIFFEPGAEIGRQDLLTYSKAHIQLDLSSGGLARNQWHLLSMPLDKVYSGDFNFGGYPYVFLRKFILITGNNSIAKAGWESFRNNKELLSVGEGFALWINGDDGVTKGKKDAGEGIDPLIGPEKRQYGLYQVNGILDLPYFEDEKQSSAHRIHKYEAEKSTFYPFFPEADHLPLRNHPASVMRGNDAYQLVNTNQVEIPLVFGEDSGRYFALVGNPFMTSIDFDKLYNDNKAKIKSSYRIWTGAEFVEYNAGNPGEKYIAPMQAFFVEKEDSCQENEKLVFNITSISK